MGRERGYFYFDGKLGLKVQFYSSFNMFFGQLAFFTTLDDNMWGITACLIQDHRALTKSDKSALSISYT